MALNVGPEVSFDKVYDWKTAEEVNGTKTYVTNDETSR
jgi:hypothetical protein